jgi:hypothetical protein
LSEEAKEEFDETLSKAEASRRIDELRQRTGRGTVHVHERGNERSPAGSHGGGR